MKKCLFTILGVIFPLLVSSQTIIATKSGDFIKGYNVDIGEDYVYYTQDISEESPINKIAKNNIFAIRKENGEQVVFDSKAEELADSIYIREEGYGDKSLPDVDIDNYEGFLLQKGNVVYVESGDTDYEKALKLYLYIANNYDYEYEVIQEDNYVYKTFTKKVGQCINFAAVYGYLLLQVGVDGLACGTYDGTCHAWTYVVINGKGYHIDTTWALKSCYPGVEHVYLDYFMMSDEERNNDNCLIKDLTVDVLPGYWVSRTNASYAATDNHYNIRSYCGFISLDEENKIVHYVDMNNEPHEFHYDI